MPGTVRYLIEICFSQFKASQQLIFLLDTEAQSIPRCLYLFVYNLSYTIVRGVRDSAETILLSDAQLVRYLKAVCSDTESVNDSVKLFK